MKKLMLLFCLCAFAFSLSAQTFNVSVSGTVADASGAAVAGVDLLVAIAPNNPAGGGFSYSNWVQTDAAGSYSDDIAVPNTAPQGYVNVAMENCDGTTVTQSAVFGLGQNNNFTLDFAWCASTPPNPCQVSITVSYAPPGAIGATLTATGSGGTPPYTYYWSNNSPPSPTLTVAQSGTYCVVMYDDAGCSATACATVQLGNPGGNCSVQVLLDSTAAGGVGLTAAATGTAPFAYLWSNGATTQSIPLDPTVPPFFLCVTVTDANGCVATGCYGNTPACSVYISGTNSNGLSAISSGTAPFAYAWSSGETTQSILPNAPGFFCVTVTDATGCEDSACYQYTGGGNPGDSCSVTIVEGNLSLFALAPGGVFGNACSYLWSTGETSSSIVPTTAGLYCVTVTCSDPATGVLCTATDCYQYPGGGNPGDSCSVSIVEGNVALFAVTSAIAPGTGVTFLWNTGETTPSIIPSGAGLYCVTVTIPNLGAVCTASDCLQVGGPFLSSTISGFVLLPDSTVNASLEGTATLYAFDPATNVPAPLDTVAIQPVSPNGLANSYDFGDVPDGIYLVKIALDPASPYFDDYLPTYYGDALFWDEAASIAVPHSQAYFNVTLVDGNGSNGPGLIGGSVTDGSGLVGHGGGDDRSGGDPVPGVSILLLDEQEQPVAHDLTDASGEYSFPDLAWGTYKVVVEITGLEQAFYWVTLSPDNPSATVGFEVTEEGATGVADALPAEGDLHVFPNPAGDWANVGIHSSASFEAQLSLTSLAGGTVFSKKQAVAKGSQVVGVSLAELPSGIYFLHLTGGREVVSRKIVKE